jgi:hypothetical protein
MCTHHQSRSLSDFGGIGFEFDTTVLKPLSDGLREEGEAAGGSGWDARKKKSDFLQRAGVTIASPGQLTGTRLYAPQLAACLHATT